MPIHTKSRQTADHFSGCLLGGAVGDALGGPTEFLSITDIRRLYGPAGQRGYVQLNSLGLAEFTDDTQMTLFTAEGLLQGLNESSNPAEFITPVWQAYQRWLRTQEFAPDPQATGLLSHPALWKRQAPGNTCLSALRSGQPGSPAQPPNNSKGCGGVMRTAPVGLLLQTEQAFTTGCMTAALTHGHPTGYLPAGFLSATVAALVAGLSLDEAIQAALKILRTWPNHQETLHAVERALQFGIDAQHPASPETIETLGAGWVAEEALSISLYCTMYGAQLNSFTSGVLLAVNHSGDNDSTGAITGNLLGLLLGKTSIPPQWITSLEMHAEIEQLALRLLTAV